MVAIATLFSIALPNATDFVWLFYKVYLAMAMGYFVDLTMAWFGGESELLRIVGEGTKIKMRTPPCCCCFCICPKPVPFTKNRIQILRGSVYQVSWSVWAYMKNSKYLGSFNFPFFDQLPNHLLLKLFHVLLYNNFVHYLRTIS